MTESIEAPEPVSLRDVVRLEPDEINQMVIDLAQNRLVVASALPPDMLPMVYMPLGLGLLAGLDGAQIGNIVEHIDKAGPRSINGYPMFMSCKVIHKDDWSVITERALKAMNAFDAALCCTCPGPTMTDTSCPVHGGDPDAD
jgi:hypothetical protein